MLLIHYTKYITGLSFDSDRAEGSIYIKLGCKTCSRTPASSLQGIQKNLHFTRTVPVNTTSTRSASFLFAKEVLLFMLLPPGF